MVIEKGEFIVIIGPSGSGKSTVLELICGFINPDSGDIILDKQVINEIEPKDRNVSMVFQNYALYPHLTAFENIEFGMKIRGVSKKHRKEKVLWAAEVLEIKEYLKKKPSELSGGQRQRIALARAIVREPKLFLMDEPLSNLDAKLRTQTSNEITSLHKNIKGTTIYVTHDQTEALTMADRIVVLNKGQIQQIGTPIELYTKPNNVFVATFIGKPEINLFNTKVVENKLVLDNDIHINLEIEENNIYENEFILGIRAENILITEEKHNSIVAKIYKKEYLGSEVILYVKHNNIDFTIKTWELTKYSVGDDIRVKFNILNANFFNKYTKDKL